MWWSPYFSRHSSAWQAGAGADPAAQEALDALVARLVEQRTAARAAKDWQAADTIRDQLAAAGIVVEDGPDGARWHVKGG